MIDGNARCGCATRVAIGLAVAAADWVELLCANRWLGLAAAFCIRDLALTDTEVTILSLRAGQPPDGAANSPGRLRGLIIVAREKHDREETG
jgi:hypothetical protein